MICLLLVSTLVDIVSIGIFLAEMIASTAFWKSMPELRPENDTRPLLSMVSELRFNDEVTIDSYLARSAGQTLVSTVGFNVFNANACSALSFWLGISRTRSPVPGSTILA